MPVNLTALLQSLSLIGANCIPFMLVRCQRECGCYYGEALKPLAISTFFPNQNTCPATTNVEPVAEWRMSGEFF